MAPFSDVISVRKMLSVTFWLVGTKHLHVNKLVKVDYKWRTGAIGSPTCPGPQSGLIVDALRDATSVTEMTPLNIMAALYKTRFNLLKVGYNFKTGAPHSPTCPGPNAYSSSKHCEGGEWSPVLLLQQSRSVPLPVRVLPAGSRWSVHLCQPRLAASSRLLRNSAWSTVAVSLSGGTRADKLRPQVVPLICPPASRHSWSGHADWSWSPSELACQGTSEGRSAVEVSTWQLASTSKRPPYRRKASHLLLSCGVGWQTWYGAF